MRLDAVSILHRTGHASRKLGDELAALRILENLGAILDDEFGDDDIDDLAGLITAVSVMARRNRPPVDGNIFDVVGILDR